MNPMPSHLTRVLIAASVLSLASMAAAPAVTVVLTATKTASPGSDPAGQDVDADNRLRAYAADDLALDGWIGFDVSEIALLEYPVVVTSARLTLYAEGDLDGGPFQSVSGTPQLGVWYSSHDGWDRGGGGFPAALDVSLVNTPAPGPFPTTTRTAYEIDLLASPAVNWTNFLTDDELSLVLRLANDPGGTHWAYWYGSGERLGDNTVGGHAGDDPVGPGGSGAFAPRLVLEYQPVPEPSAALLLAAALAVRCTWRGRPAHR